MPARRLTAGAALALAVWAVLLTSSVAFAAEPSPSPTAQDPQRACQKINPTGAMGAAARLACDVARGGLSGPGHDVTQSAGQAAAGAAQGLTQSAETAFTTWLASGAAWVVQRVSDKVAGASTTPNLDPTQAAAFAHVYARVVGVALALSVLLVLIGILEATLTQRPGGLRRVVVGIAVAGIGLGAVPVGTAILLRVVDDLSLYVAGDQTQQVAQVFKLTIQFMGQADPGMGASAFGLTSLGMLIGGTLLWLELVVRDALIYVFLGVVPLACAAVQWPRLEGTLRQVLFGGLALILSKLVIVIVLAVGFSVLFSGPSLENALAAMFILLIAATTPFGIARVLPLAVDELTLAHQGRLRRAIVTGVGTTAVLVAAVATRGGAAGGRGLPIAPPMGSSQARGQGRSGGSGAASPITLGPWGRPPPEPPKRSRRSKGGEAPPGR